MLVISILSFLMLKIHKDFYVFMEIIDIKFCYLSIIFKLMIKKVNLNL